MTNMRDFAPSTATRWNAAVFARCVALALGCSTLVARVAAAQDYLSGVPQPASVIAGYEGRDSVDLLARQHAALRVVRRLIMEMYNDRAMRDRESGRPPAQTMDEVRLLAAYADAERELGQPRFDAGAATQRLQWNRLLSKYAVLDSVFRDDVIRRFFSPEWAAEYRAAKGRAAARFASADARYVDSTSASNPVVEERISQAGSVMPPGYLQAMPAVDRVLSDMKVADSVATRARQYAAVSYLGQILSVLTWDHIFVQGGRSGLTAKEDSLNRGYLTAENLLRSGSGNVPGLMALMGSYAAETSPLRSELLDRYFSPRWKAALTRLDARYRAVDNPPATVRAAPLPPATGHAEYFANLRCASGATGARGKTVSDMEKEACDMAMAEIGRHWAKQPDGWTSVLPAGTDVPTLVYIRQVVSLAAEQVKTHELSAADKLNGLEWAGEVWFSKVPAREEGAPRTFTAGGEIMRQQTWFWSQWVDYQPPPLGVRRVKGKWEVDPKNSLLEGLPGR